MNKIHDRAIVGKNVEMGEGNVIGPNVVIEDGVRIGSNNKIDPAVVIFAGTTIGDDNRIHTGTVLGDVPQDTAFKDGTPSFLTIGNNNRIREYCTIHRGTKEDTTTTIADDTFLMGYTHVAHNCKIGTGVITVNTAVLGGYVEVEDYAFISASVVIHQFCRVGKYAIVGGDSALNQDVPPFMMAGGRPATVIGLNVVGLKRSGMSPELRSELKKAYKILYRSGLAINNALEQITRQCKGAEIDYLVTFIKNAERGIASGPDE